MERKRLTPEQIDYLTTFHSDLINYDMAPFSNEEFEDEAAQGHGQYEFVNSHLGVLGFICIGSDPDIPNSDYAYVNLSIWVRELPHHWLEEIAKKNGVDVISEQGSSTLEYGLGIRRIPIFPKEGQTLTVEDLVNTYIDTMANTIKDVETAEHTFSQARKLMEPTELS